MKRADWLFGAGLLLVTSLATAWMAGPVVAEPGRVLYGEPGDVYGTLSTLRRVSAGLDAATLPWGSGFQPLVDLPAALVARVVGEVASYNLFLLVSFPLAALGAWLLGMRLLGDRWAAGFVALAFAFSPYHLAHARQHLDQAQVHWIPLLAWAVVGLAARPGLRQAALVGGLYVAAVLSNYYFAYLLGFMALVLVLPALGARTTRRAAWLLLLVLVPALAGGLLAARPGAGPSRARQASLAELTRYSARPVEYLLPSARHPVWGNAVGRLWPVRQHGSNSIEQSLGLGLVSLVLASVGLGRSLAGRSGLSRRWALALLALAVGAFVLSLPPDWRLGGLRLPGPHQLLVTVVPWFRAVARFGSLVQLAVVLLAGAALTRQGGAGGRPLPALVACALVLFEYADQPPRPRHRVDPPELVQRLAGAPGSVADYPLEAYRYLRLWESLEGRRRIPSVGLRRAGVESLEWPGAPPVLAALGVRWIVWHADAAPMPGLPDGVVLVERYGSSWLLEVTAAAAETALIYSQGFHVPEPAPGGVQAWLEEAGRLQLVLARGAEAARGDLVADVWSLGAERALQVSGPSGRSETVTVNATPRTWRWSGLRLAGTPAEVRFAPWPGPRSADEVLGNGDPRRLSVALARAAFRPRELDFGPAGRLSYEEGFHELEPDGRRWLRARARLELSPAAGSRRLLLELVAHARPRRLELREEGRLVLALEASPERFVSAAVSLEARAYALELVVPEGESRASEADARLVSIAWRHVRLAMAP